MIKLGLVFLSILFAFVQFSLGVRAQSQEALLACGDRPAAFCMVEDATEDLEAKLDGSDDRFLFRQEIGQLAAANFVIGHAEKAQELLVRLSTDEVQEILFGISDPNNAMFITETILFELERSGRNSFVEAALESVKDEQRASFDRSLSSIAFALARAGELERAAEIMKLSSDVSDVEMADRLKGWQAIARMMESSNDATATPKKIENLAAESRGAPGGTFDALAFFENILLISQDPSAVFGFFHAYPDLAPQFAAALVSLSLEADSRICNSVSCPARVAKSTPSISVRQAISAHVDVQISESLQREFGATEAEVFELVELAAWSVHFNDLARTKQLTDYLTANLETIEFSGMGVAFFSNFLMMVQYMNDDPDGVEETFWRFSSDQDDDVRLSFPTLVDLIAFQGNIEKASALMGPGWDAIKKLEPEAHPRYGMVQSKAHAAITAAAVHWLDALE